MFDIGSRIVNLRKLHNISANKLSKELNVDPSTINKIEKGTAKPSIDLLFNICNYFEINLSEFFADDQAPELPLEVRRVCGKIQQLPPERLKILESVLDTWADSD